MPPSGSTKATADINFTLRRVFGKSTFRPYQREIITAALERNDVFVQAGKVFTRLHLCYLLCTHAYEMQLHHSGR